MFSGWSICILQIHPYNIVVVVGFWMLDIYIFHICGYLYARGAITNDVTTRGLLNIFNETWGKRHVSWVSLSLCFFCIINSFFFIWGYYPTLICDSNTIVFCSFVELLVIRYGVSTVFYYYYVLCVRMCGIVNIASVRVRVSFKCRFKPALNSSVETWVIWFSIWLFTFYVYDLSNICTFLYYSCTYFWIS